MWNGIPRSKLCPSCNLKKASNAESLRIAEERFGKRKSKDITSKIPSIRNPKTKRTISTKFDFYKTTAWKWLSRLVLVTYADNEGYVACSTSPHRIYHVTSRSMHAGHYIKVRDSNSTNYATALNFYNIAPQSHHDNIYGGGCQDVMRGWLVKKYGENKVLELERMKRIPFKLSKSVLDELSDKYRKEYKELLKKRNMVDPWKK